MLSSCQPGIDWYQYSVIAGSGRMSLITDRFWICSDGNRDTFNIAGWCYMEEDKMPRIAAMLEEDGWTVRCTPHSIQISYDAIQATLSRYGYYTVTYASSFDEARYIIKEIYSTVYAALESPFV